jgi:hypothetical protein
MVSYFGTGKHLRGLKHTERGKGSDLKIAMIFTDADE